MFIGAFELLWEENGYTCTVYSALDYSVQFIVLVHNMELEPNVGMTESVESVLVSQSPDVYFMWSN